MNNRTSNPYSDSWSMRKETLNRHFTDEDDYVSPHPAHPLNIDPRPKTLQEHFEGVRERSRNSPLWLIILIGIGAFLIYSIVM